MFPRVIGRYQLFGEIASGGMASVHYGRMSGPAGFARTVAIKRLHPHFSKEAEFVAMLIDEARVAARIRHPNVVSTLDILNEDDETLLVMEYVQGVTLSHLLRELGGEMIPVPIAVGIMTGALSGLHAAHEARNEAGEPLCVVHRDVSPQNILIGTDGVARVVDFGIAKAAGRLQTTQDGQLKGKNAYMAPEQIRGQAVDRRTDVFAASVVLWEILAGRRLFKGDSAAAILNAVLEQPVPPVAALRSDLPGELDAVIVRGLARDPAERFTSAREMAVALEQAARPATTREIGEWVEAVASAALTVRSDQLAQIEASTSGSHGLSEASVVAVSAEREAGATATDTSQVSDATPKPRHGKRRISLFALAAASLAIAVGVVVWRASLSSSGAAHGGSETLAPSGPPEVLPAASGSPAPSAAVSARPPTPSGSATQPPVSERVRRDERPKPRSTTPPAAKNCNPPYTIDANGTRHWKKGC